MEVNANTNIDAAQRVIVSQNRQRSTPQESSDTTSFYRVQALDVALKTTPEVRPDAVARAKELISNVKYPPADTIRGISTLLALKLDSAEGSSE